MADLRNYQKVTPSPSNTTQSVKRRREETHDPDVIPHTSKRHCNIIDGRRHVKYQRYSKPPYTYLGMMALAIQSTEEKMLTLFGIQEALAEMFPFFKGEYQGWRDSIRHNLSHNPCFIKTNRRNKSSSGCYWTVDLSLVPANAFTRTRVTKEIETVWAPTLTQQLEVPDIEMPPPRTPPMKMWTARKRTIKMAAKTPSQTQTPSPSLMYTEAQYTRYLREQTEGDSVPLSKLPPFAALMYDNTTSDVFAAADNLYLLCPAPNYDSPSQAEIRQTTEPKTPHFRYPALTRDSIGYSTNFVTSSSRDYYSIRIPETPSPAIAPTNEDPFQRYFSNLSSMVVPESLLHVNEDPEQTISSQQHLVSTTQSETLYQPKYELISPRPKSCHLNGSEASLPVSELFASPAPPSDCSTISYISDNSHASTLNQDTSLQLLDFSTVSFHDLQNDSSLSDIFT